MKTTHTTKLAAGEEHDNSNRSSTSPHSVPPPAAQRFRGAEGFALVKALTNVLENKLHYNQLAVREVLRCAVTQLLQLPGHDRSWQDE